MKGVAKLIAWCLQLFGSYDGLIADLDPDNKHLADKVHNFCLLKQREMIPSTCFFELLESDYTKKTWIPGSFKGIVVKEASAHIPGWGRTGLNTDHFDLNKFSGPDDGSFVAVSREIYQMVSNMKNRNNSKNDALHQISTVSDEQFEGILDSLYFKEINHRRQDIPYPSQDTCTWMLESTQYKEWVDPAEASMYNRILWIKGKPGVGKSTLMNYLYEQSTGMLPGMKKSSFFFNARGVELEKTTSGLYRALLWDILRNYKDLVTVFHEVHLDAIKDSGWREQHLKNLLSDAITKLGNRPLVCYIDALDECPEDQAREMVGYFRNICSGATKSGSQFKLCFSSRHYPSISIANGISLILEEQLGHYIDLQHYIDSELIKEVEVEDLKQATRIQDKLLQKSSGIFLYIKLVIDKLKKDFSNGEANAKVLEGRVDELPQGLRALYSDMLSQKSDDTGDLQSIEATRLCLQWMLFAHSPMTPDQLYFAIQHGIHEGTIICGPLPQEDYETLRARMHRFIVSSSKGAVEIICIDDYDDDNNRARKIESRFITQFIHESVRDYLLEENGYQKLYPSSQGSFAGESHDKLKEICYKGVQLVAYHWEPGSGIPKEGRLNPFLSQYAIPGTLQHAEKAQAFEVQQDDFLSSFSVNTWLKAYRYCTPTGNLGRFDDFRNASVREDLFAWKKNQTNSQLLYILAMANLPHLIGVHPDRAHHTEVEGGLYGAPLIAATTFRHHECVCALGVPVSKEDGRLVTFDEGNRCYMPALYQPPYTSCRNFFYDCIRLNCLPLVKALAVHIGDINKYEHGLGRPLSWAARFLALDVIKWLLDEKADPMIQDPFFEVRTYTPFGNCTDYYDKCAGFVSPLDEWWKPEESRIQVDPHESKMRKKRYFKWMDRWIFTREDFNKGFSALHHVCSNYLRHDGVPAALQIFLECPRVCPDVRDRLGRTPFSYAVEQGWLEAAQMLLQTEHVDADSKSDCERTPLSYAVDPAFLTPRDTCGKAVPWLLSLNTVDPNSRDDDGRTPLSHAVAGRYVEKTVVDSLVQFGLSKFGSGTGTSRKDFFDSRDNCGSTPLRWSAETLLVTRKSDEDDDPWERFFFSTGIVELLLATGEVDPVSEADDGFSPLDVARSYLTDYNDPEPRIVVGKMEECIRKFSVTPCSHALPPIKLGAEYIFPPLTMLRDFEYRGGSQCHDTQIRMLCGWENGDDPPERVKFLGVRYIKFS
ncbi:hypothetical protein F5Y02DRAFT_389498 [Annulohypoxylon stygium]|nr:hypothetical protein F5Y02DRAFT_389498 [Annulohypoxylon stygium]